MEPSLNLKLEPYDPDAIDGDSDGVVQEGTAWERPAGTRLLLASGMEVAKGETSASRSASLRVVDAEGRDIQYRPSWQRMEEAPQPGQSRTALSDHGARSLREMAMTDLRAATAPRQATPSKETVQAAPSKETVQAAPKPKPTAATPKLDPETVDATAAALHDAWRAGRRLPDGTYEPRMKDDGKGGEIDIANTNYADLPEKWQAENKASAESALRAIAENPDARMEELAAIVHDQWLERNGSWAPEELKVDYWDLPEREKQKDRDVVNAALAALKKKKIKDTVAALGDGRPDRDWNDFSGLSNAQLGDLSNYLFDLIDEERYSASPDQDLIKELTNRHRAVRAEQQIRVEEERKKSAARDLFYENSVWNELFVGEDAVYTFGLPFGRDEVRQFADLPLARMSVIADYVGRHAALLRQRADDAEQRLDPKDWDASDEIQRHRAMQRIVQNMSEYAGLALRRQQIDLKERFDQYFSMSQGEVADLIADLKDALWNGEALSQSLGRPEVSDLRENYFIGPPTNDIRAMLETAKRRVSGSFGSPDTVPADSELLDKTIYGDQVPRPVDKRRPTLAVSPTDGGIPEPKIFGTDGKITSWSEASEHLANGGSLEDIPNRFWAYAIADNASDSEYDTDAMFYEVEPSQGGAIGDTRIYVLRNPDGSLGDQGYVIKGNIDPRDALHEVIGWNLAVAHGISSEGATWVDPGSDERDLRATVALPHIFNVLPKGEVEIGYTNYNAELAATEEGMPAALGHFLHNYLLALVDRHPGNGYIVEVGDQVFGIPIDQSWSAAGRGEQTIFEYAYFWFPMHSEILDDLRGIETEEHYQRIENVFDSILERAEGVVAAGEDSFVERTVKAAGVDLDNIDPDYLVYVGNTLLRNARDYFQKYSERVERLRKDRAEFMSRLRISTFLRPSSEEPDTDFMEYNEGEFR